MVDVVRATRDARRSQRSIPPAAALLAAVTLAGTLAVATVSTPTLTAAAVGAIALGLLAIGRPAVALVLWVPVVFVGAAPRAEVLVQGLPLAFAALFVVSGTTGVQAGSAARAARAGSALLVWLAFSLAWTGVERSGLNQFVAWAAGVATMVVIATVVQREPGAARLLASAFVVGVTVSCALGLSGLDASLLGANAPTKAGDRVVGGLGDPNTLAAVAVPGLALGAALARAGGRGRILWLVAMCVMAAAFVGTESRGGLVAAVVAFAYGVSLVRSARGRVAAVAVAAAIAVLLLAGGGPGVEERVFSDEDTGRATLWPAAATAFADDPLTGIGIGRFTGEAHQYADRTGTFRYDLLVLTPKRIHNTYLELLAETGIVGLGLFLAVLVVAIGSTRRAAWRFAARGDRELAALAHGVVAGTLGFLAAALFLSVGSEKPLWILLGLGLGLDRMVRRAA